jgi:hypothetical protein
MIGQMVIEDHPMPHELYVGQKMLRVVDYALCQRVLWDCHLFLLQRPQPAAFPRGTRRA